MYNDIGFEYALYFPKYNNHLDVEDLTFYSELEYRGYCIGKRVSDSKYEIIDSNYGNVFDISEDINPEDVNSVNIISRNFSVYIEPDKINNCLEGFLLEVSIDNDDYINRYIVYKDQIVNSDKLGATHIINIGDNDISNDIRLVPYPFDFLTYRNFVYVHDDNHTDVYSFVYVEDHYSLQFQTSINYYIFSTLRDGEDNYFMIKENNKYGLCDKSGNVLINPEYSNIIGVQNSNVIVQKDDLYGVINLKDKKKNSEIKYKYIKFIGGGYYIKTDESNSKYLVSPNGKEYEDTLGQTQIIFTSVDDNSPNRFINIRAYKIDFGDYVKLFYNVEEWGKEYWISSKDYMPM